MCPQATKTESGLEFIDFEKFQILAPTLIFRYQYQKKKKLISKISLNYFSKKFLNN